jgi:hypothetical protein
MCTKCCQVFRPQRRNLIDCFGVRKLINTHVQFQIMGEWRGCCKTTVPWNLRFQTFRRLASTVVDH